MRKIQLILFTIFFFALLNSCKHNPDTKVIKPQESKEPELGFDIKDVSNLRGVSADSCINLFWDKLEVDGLNKIIIEYNEEGKNHNKIELDKEQISWSLSQGQHGQLFSFKIYTTYLDGSESEGITTDCIFTKYSEFNNPILFINTPDNMEITTKEWLSDQNLELADCIIVDKNSPENQEIKLDIKCRGNTSMGQPKKNFSIKLDKKENLFNIADGKHKSYALIANYSDKSLIRNELAYYMGNEVFTNMGWNPNTQVINLFINGTYRGIYLLTERIKIDEKEINIPDVSKTAKLTDLNNDDEINFLDGGWILEINERLDEKYNWETDNKIPISLKDPDEYESWEDIKGYLNLVESVLYDEDIFNDATNGWRKYLDENSFIDWYLVNEIAKNNDAKWYSSCYMYFNPVTQKLYMGPVWDFDIGFGNIDYNGCDDYQGFWIKGCGWYSRLFADSIFVENVKSRWTAKKNEIDALVQNIDDMADNLQGDVDVNFTKWPILGEYVWPNAPGYAERTTYQSEVDYLKTWLTNRIAWLDTAIGEL